MLSGHLDAVFPQGTVAEIEAIAAEKNIDRVVFKPTGGGSNANFFAHGGAMTLDGFGPVGDLSHTRDEYPEADTIVPRFELLVFFDALP